MEQRESRILPLLLMSLACALVSCNPPRNAYSSNQNDNETSETSRILFLNYLLSRDSAQGSYNATLLSIMIREGEIKASPKKTGQAKAGDLEILLLNMDQQALENQHIPNPLDRSVEYVNQAGQLEHKMIQLDSVQFSVRMQIAPGASSVVLNRITGNNSEDSLLLITPIQ